MRTYRLYSVIVGGHHNPRSNIVTIEPAVILHSRGYSCKKKRRKMSSLGTNTILVEYPETRMAILAFLVSNFHLVRCNTNVSYVIPKVPLTFANHELLIYFWSILLSKLFNFVKCFWCVACDVSFLVISRNCRYITVLKSPVLNSTKYFWFEFGINAT